MVNLKLSANSQLWQCHDNSGIAIYNGYDGNTIFLRSNLDATDPGADQPQTRSQILPSLIDEFTSAKIVSILAVNELESDKILNQLINWGILIGSED